MVSVKIRKRRGPEAGGVLQEFNGVGAEPASQRAPYEGGERGEANKKDRDLGESTCWKEGDARVLELVIFLQVDAQRTCFQRPDRRSR